jgi:hypothetical protein
MRRVALISDIHGNAVALEAVLADGRPSGMPDPDCWAAGLERRIARRNALAANHLLEARDADLLASS